jgi:hypothetical protein
MVGGGEDWMHARRAVAVSTNRGPLRSWVRGLPIVLTVVVAGCQSWHQVDLTPPAIVSEDGPEEVRVGLRDGSNVILVQPEIAADSLRGDSDPNFLGYSSEAAVALKDIRRVEVKRFSVWRTAVGVVVYGFVGLVALGCLFSGC